MDSKKLKLKVLAIVQARTGSKRLPGKVLMNIAGKPMLWHVINRLRHSKKIDETVLAIPDTKDNDVIEKFAKKIMIPYYRGSEENVLFRYYKASEQFSGDVIVRITADCPLIDPIIVDEVVSCYFQKNADYASNNTLGKTFPRGFDVEVFSFNVLKEVFHKAKNSRHKEHVTPYIYENPNSFNLLNVEAEGIIKRPDLRLTVDTTEDFELIKKIYDNLYKKGKLFLSQDVINFLNDNPELAIINSNIEQAV